MTHFLKNKQRYLYFKNQEFGYIKKGYIPVRVMYNQKCNSKHQNANCQKVNCFAPNKGILTKASSTVYLKHSFNFTFKELLCPLKSTTMYSMVY